MIFLFGKSSQYDFVQNLTVLSQEMYNHSKGEVFISMAVHRQCVLYDRECNGCGECDRCDLDPEKICDNCMKCVTGDADYRSVNIDGIFLDQNQVTGGEISPSDSGL